MLNFFSFMANLLLPSSLIFSPMDSPKPDQSIPENAKNTVNGPFTDHFHKWLHENDYGMYNFASPELGIQASFGGKQSGKEVAKRRPILFLHGNSDGALAEGSEEWNQGWSASIEYFMAKGYSTAELYALSYGDRNLANSLTRSVDCQTLLRLRRFLEAILAYTGADKVDIVAHSMGVTLGRHIVQGRSLLELGSGKGDEQDPLDQCYLGPPLRHRIHTFLGIAGANYGLCLCAGPGLADTAPACNRQTGFWAGSSCADSTPEECHIAQPEPHRAHCHGGGQYATWLHRLNAPQRPKDANLVISIWSSADQILGPTNFAWGRLTSLIPNSDHSMIYSEHSHHSIKWKTVQDQLEFLIDGQEHLFEGEVRKMGKGKMKERKEEKN